MGLFIAVVYGLASLGEARPNSQARIAVAPSVVLTAGGLFYQTRNYLGHWQDSSSIWTHTLQQVDDEYDRIVAGAPAESALRLAGLFNPWFKLGLAYADAGRHAEAAVHFAEAADLHRITPRPGIASAGRYCAAA